MRIVFAGTPEAAVPTLEGLVEAGHEIVAVVTREDAPLGRKRVMTPSPVAARAEELGLRILKANRLGDEVTGEILALEPELGVVVAYGGLIREPLLSGPAHGWINLHFSELPQWRGAAPVQRAVISGTGRTGIAVFQLEAGLDTGPTFVNRGVDILEGETSGELLARLAIEGVKDVTETVASIAGGTAVTSPQEGEPTHAAKLTTEDGVIDWTQPTHLVAARIHGVTPEPGAATTLDEARFKIHEIKSADATIETLDPGVVSAASKRILVGTGDGTLELVRVQPAGKAAMDAGAWWRGNQAAQLGEEVKFA